MSETPPALNPGRLREARLRAREALLGARVPEGHWVGELSTSALSTATAIVALALADKESAPLVERALGWLAAHQNPDGGWGDTNRSLSNLSTTALCWAAFGAVPGAEEPHSSTIRAAERWLAQRAGSLEPTRLAPAIITRYGRDRTFSVPILTMCALAGRLGEGPEAWRHVLPLPFELAALPHRCFAALRLPVVSYALPALIAIGQARHFHRPSRNPIARATRNFTRSRTLAVLEKIQPSNGGFLEATPLTSFVTMSLAASGQAEHPVTRRGVEFLRASVRPDGSWPIDTNLATWVTTLSINALGPACQELIDDTGRAALCDWLLAQQHRVKHPYTHAAPGGWAWTNLPGGVPDADDTAGALLALRHLGGIDVRTREAARAGVNWLLDLQNRDGGIPTFCQGWGALPFDRSGPDLTAHAIRAWLAWQNELAPAQQARVGRALPRALQYLAGAQRADGSWLPLWFGNQHAPGDENPAYGTARVAEALTDALARGWQQAQAPLARALAWLLHAQNSDGTWGLNGEGSGTIEETALALAALSHPTAQAIANRQSVQEALARGTCWLVARVETGQWIEPAPIGFYFAKLWYYERLYPLIFATDALELISSVR